MKSLLLIPAAVLGLSFGDLDSKANNVGRYDPVITWVETAMSYEPGMVTIRGRNLELVSRVEIAGHAVPMVSSSGSQIVIRPGIMPPGFTTLELVRPSGARVSREIEFAPSLRATRSQDLLTGDDTFCLVLNPGEPGVFWVEWSHRASGTPLNVPGVYNPLLLDLTTPRSGAMCSEMSTTGLPVAMVERIPSVLLGGLFDTLYLQAFCLLGDGTEQCLTNMVTVPIFPSDVGHVRQYEPVVSSVETTMSYEPGLVSIHGRRLDLIARVEIDGRAVPVVRNSGDELVVRPGNMDPGFAALALVRPDGRRLMEAIEFTPSLRANRVGDALAITLNPGEHASAWIRWSYRLLESPSTLPGVYFPLMLDLDTVNAGEMCSVHALTGEPVVMTEAVPPLLVHGGLFDSLYLQAFLLLGEHTAPFACNTNLATVPVPVATLPYHFLPVEPVN
jgi:hypothetical protein